MQPALSHTILQPLGGNPIFIDLDELHAFYRGNLKYRAALMIQLDLPACVIRGFLGCWKARTPATFLEEYSVTELFKIYNTAKYQAMDEMAAKTKPELIKRLTLLRWQLKEKLSTWHSEVQKYLIKLNLEGITKQTVLDILRGIPMKPRFKFAEGDAWRRYAVKPDALPVDQAEKWFHTIFLPELAATVIAPAGTRPAQSPPRVTSEFVRFNGGGLETINKLLSETSDSNIKDMLCEFDVMEDCIWTAGSLREDKLLKTKARCLMVLETSSQDTDRILKQWPTIEDDLSKHKLFAKHEDEEEEIQEPARKKPCIGLLHQVQQAAATGDVDFRNNRSKILHALEGVIKIYRDASLRNQLDHISFQGFKGEVRAIHVAYQTHIISPGKASDALTFVFRGLSESQQNSKPGLLVIWWKLELAIKHEFRFGFSLQFFPKLLSYVGNGRCLAEKDSGQIMLLQWTAQMMCGVQVELPATEHLRCMKQPSLKPEFDIFLEALRRCDKGVLAHALDHPQTAFVDDVQGELRLPRWGESLLWFDI
jgi:hypothetical protein